MKHLAISILILLTFLSYSPSLKNYFVWDDVFFIAQNNYIKDLSFLPQYFYSAKTYSSRPNYYIYRPLRTLTFALEYKIWGLNAFGFHLTNILLHILNVLMAYFLVSRLASSRRLGFITALIFSLHPVQTEAVAWIKGRADLLFTFFFLIGFLAFLKKKEEEKNNPWLMAAIYISFLLALLSKVMAITFPLILILYIISLEKRRELFPLKALEKDKSLFISLFLISTAFLFLRHSVIGSIGQGGSYPGGRGYYTFLTMLRVFPNYFRIIIYPFNLIADYSGLKVSRSIFEKEVLASFLFYLAVIYILAASWKKNRLIFFGLFFFFITLLPVSNIIPTMQFMAERFLYLPCLGIFLILAFFIKKGSFSLTSRKLLLWAVVSFYILNLIPLTVERSRVWRNEVTLWEETFNTAPKSSRIIENLAFAYLNSGRSAEAVPLLEKFLPKTKKRYKILDYLGEAYYRQNKFKEAHYYFEEAIREKNDFAKAYAHLGILWGNKKKYELSKKYLEKAIELEPDSPDSSYYYNYLGLTFKNSGQEEKSKEMFEKALLRNPDNIEALKNLGAVFWQEKNWEECLHIYKRLSRLSPKKAEFKYYLKQIERKLEQR